MAGPLPVLFFGDLFEAEVATVGLNPSDHEYLSKDGAVLTGARQRFATLDSLGASDRASLTDAQSNEAIAWMRDYYVHNQGEWYSAVVAAIIPPRN